MAVDAGQWLRRNQEAQENKRQRRRAQDDRRMEVWIRMADSTPIYPPLQVAAHRAQRLVPTPRAKFTQALTKGPRSYPSINTGRRSGDPGAQK
jgi:hypothetical protein